MVGEAEGWRVLARRASGAASRGDAASEREDEAWIEKAKYTLVRRGNEVVHIEPPGSSAPLYQRDHYRDGVTLWRRVERFVPEEQVHW
ncbi:MAG: hypothetical protein WDA75_00115 [Candidatus Latescibacterota bacterium]